MSIDYLLYKKDLSPLIIQEIKEKLKNNFELIETGLKDDSEIDIKYFLVKPIDKDLNIYEEGFEIVLQDDGKYWIGTYDYEEENFSKFIKVIANIAELLELLIEDPQTSETPLSPEEFLKSNHSETMKIQTQTIHNAEKLLDEKIMEDTDQGAFKTFTLKNEDPQDPQFNIEEKFETFVPKDWEFIFDEGKQEITLSDGEDTKVVFRLHLRSYDTEEERLKEIDNLLNRDFWIKELIDLQSYPIEIIHPEDSEKEEGFNALHIYSDQNEHDVRHTVITEFVDKTYILGSYSIPNEEIEIAEKLLIISFLFVYAEFNQEEADIVKFILNQTKKLESIVNSLRE